MASLQQYGCLARLCDAALSPGAGGPEVLMLRSWKEMITPQRSEAEQWLGYSTTSLRRFWASDGTSDSVLHEVYFGSEEHEKVSTIFAAQPAVPRAYLDMNPGLWETVKILKIERVENGFQEEGCARPHFAAVKRSLELQAVDFELGVHTRWAFHGTSAVESIVSDPVSGFQPLMSGARANAMSPSLWGLGTYFARDSKYAYDGGFCQAAADGSRRVLLCLMATGMPCLGDPQHRGTLPIRCGRHRYNSSVDSLSNPEIFVTQASGAAYPAYVITFAS